MAAFKIPLPDCEPRALAEGFVSLDCNVAEEPAPKPSTPSVKLKDGLMSPEELSGRNEKDVVSEELVSVLVTGVSVSVASSFVVVEVVLVICFVVVVCLVVV